jgi:hypothetical protein
MLRAALSPRTLAACSHVWELWTARDCGQHDCCTFLRAEPTLDDLYAYGVGTCDAQRVNSQRTSMLMLAMSGTLLARDG